MELKEKGQEANIQTFNQLMVTLGWETGKDFDLGALLEYKDDKDPEFIYFQNMGDLNGPFFIQLDKDAGVGGDVGADGNKETMKIMSLDPYRQVHLCLWDYDAISSGGRAARFADDNISIEILDDAGSSHTAIVPDDVSEQMGNCVCLATIDNTSPMGAKFVNQSIVGTAKAFSEVANWLKEVATTTG
jgi:tellurite resistance protein TerA